MTCDDRNCLGSTMAWQSPPTGRVGRHFIKVVKITFVMIGGLYHNKYDGQELAPLGSVCETGTKFS